MGSVDGEKDERDGLDPGDRQDRSDGTSPSAAGVVLYTIGHSSRSTDEFMGLLREAAVQTLVDVRSFPGSSRHPHFRQQELRFVLESSRIRYFWEGRALGGFRRGRHGSPHLAIQAAGFRAYADHMESDLFEKGAARVIQAARLSRVAILCAERLPGRCHRSFLSDYLLFQGASVQHILASGKRLQHLLNSRARVDGDRLVYDLQVQEELNLGCGTEP